MLHLSCSVARLVGAHESAVAGDINCENSGEPSFQALANPNTLPECADIAIYASVVVPTRGSDGFGRPPDASNAGRPLPRPISDICGGATGHCPGLGSF